ncbi:GntR family transcriptional regulator [Paracoccus siganidrum]|uniref:GntR family transcriptional regulator n=1 Tax=Paracoccus siganidrum TaxID=1276757 RepID=A0A419A3W4_9RHOB|nr:GntR family transcriptional regulator [Paracoccus siganidrum]RJL08231.1 GntR family transcriptional regulator [Paracoccus siganidrum]RMC35224.1 GntR family transcriptional regulator [Paracoccus siganidrum]
MRAEDGNGADLLADQAYGRLVALLRDGTLRAGEFVTMPGLTGATGLSIAAMREAVKRADSRGLLRILPKRGVLVMDAGPETTRDCLDMRMALDCEGARRLIARGVPDLAELRDAHEATLAAARGARAPDLTRRAQRVDLSLHDALAAGLADNRMLAEAYATNRDRIAIIQNTRPFLADRIVSAMEEHLVILGALERGDAQAAVAAIREHYRQTLRWWGVEV